MELQSSSDEFVVSESRTELYILVKRFINGFLVLFLVYLIGSFGLSFAWILIGLCLWILQWKHSEQQIKRENIQRAIALDESTAIRSVIKDLPSWVQFPDCERAEWINKIIKQLWPFIDEYIKGLIKQSIEPSIISSLPDYLKSFTFERMDLGTIPLRLGSVKCYDENTSREEIIMDLELIYAGNCDIKVKVKGMIKAGIKHFQLHGILRVELRPLLKDIPLIGCVSCYFLNTPAIEFNLTNIAEILNIPGLGEILRSAIKEQIAALMVFPNKFTFKLVKNLSMKALKFVPPAGVVRIELIEAKDLRRADIGMLGLGKSDPYCNITIGSQEFKTPVIHNTINPKWHFICEAIVHQFHGQTIEIEVMDEDQGSKDDFLGKASVSIPMIANDGMVNATIKLKETKTGSLHLISSWFMLSNSMDDLKDQINESTNIKSKYESHFLERKIKFEDQPIYGSVVAISVFLDSARDLPYVSRTAGDPSPFGTLTIEKQRRHSIVKSNTINPIWEECFYFLVDHLQYDHKLIIELFDNNTNKSLGMVLINLKDVLTSENMTIEGSRPLQGRGAKSEINITVQMRILKAPKLKRNLIKLISEESVEEIESPKSETRNMPSLEEMVEGTIKPFMAAANIKSDVIEDSQISRTSGLRKRWGSSESLNKIGNLYPRIKITIRRAHGKMILTLHKAVNLPKIGDKNPDPYVKICLMNDNYKEKVVKSGVHKNSRDPIFDETFEFTHDFKGFYELEIKVCTKIRSSVSSFNKKTKILGFAKFNSDDLEKTHEITKWFDLEQLSD